MKRRTFLLAGGASALGLFAGGAGWRIGGVWWNQSAGDGWQILSDREAEIATAIAEAMFPGDDLGMPSGADVDVVETLDEYLVAIPTTKANMLRLLLHAIDEMAVGSDLSMRRFHNRPHDERVEILNAWDDSGLTVRREAFEALKLVMSMGYCESAKVLDAAGIDYECGSVE